MCRYGNQHIIPYRTAYVYRVVPDALAARASPTALPRGPPGGPLAAGAASPAGLSERSALRALSAVDETVVDEGAIALEIEAYLRVQSLCGSYSAASAGSRAAARSERSRALR